MRCSPVKLSAISTPGKRAGGANSSAICSWYAQPRAQTCRHEGFEVYVLRRCVADHILGG
jgi:hypothetical protein